MLLFVSSFTEQERIDAFMNPDKYMLGEDFIDENKDEILLFLMRIGVSYTTEISRTTQLHIESINKILSVLSKKGWIRKIIPNKFNPQPMFYKRIPEFWQMSLDSYEKVNRCSWWIPTPEGLAYIKEKYKGEGKQVHKSLIEYYQLKILDNSRQVSVENRGVL